MDAMRCEAMGCRACELVAWHTSARPSLRRRLYCAASSAYRGACSWSSKAAARASSSGGGA
eukprot:1195372-Prorocentrum_minimum.AAC.8